MPPPVDYTVFVVASGAFLASLAAFGALYLCTRGRTEDEAVDRLKNLAGHYGLEVGNKVSRKDH